MKSDDMNIQTINENNAESEKKSHGEQGQPITNSFGTFAQYLDQFRWFHNILHTNR